MAIVIDSFVDEDARLSLLQQLPHLDKGQTRALPTLKVPLSLEHRMCSIVRNGKAEFLETECPYAPYSMQEDETVVSLPARLASGSVPMHQDCFSPYDAAEHVPIDGYVAILYLDGVGKLVLDAGAGEQAIDIVPGRFVAWPNGDCYHRLEAPPGSGARAMVGPIAIDAEGFTQRAHDVWSTHPGYIGYCKNEAAKAEQEGDHEAVLRALRNIGIGGVATDLIKEYEDRRAANQALPLVFTLTCEPNSQSSEEEEGAEYQLVCTGLAGDTITKLPVSGTATFGSVKSALFKAIKDSSPKEVVPRAILTDGTLLGEEHEDTTIEGLFALP